MFKSKYDILFGFCFTFIILLAIYLGFQRTQERKLEDYLMLLKEKIETMISEEDKGQFDEFFTEFTESLIGDSASKAHVERLAENLFELRKNKTILSQDDLKQLLSPANRDTPGKAGLYFFDYLDEKDWQDMAAHFKKSFAMCDSIRVNKYKMKKISKKLKKQIDIHARVSQKLKANAMEAVERFKELKQRTIDSKMLEKLRREMERLKRENDRIHSKLSRLDEMQLLLNKEKKELQKQRQKIDSLKSEFM